MNQATDMEHLRHPQQPQPQPMGAPMMESPTLDENLMAQVRNLENCLQATRQEKAGLQIELEALRESLLEAVQQNVNLRAQLIQQRQAAQTPQLRLPQGG